MGQMVDTLATEHQISDGVGVSVAAAPLDRVTVRGAHPDHALLSPQLTDPKGVAHIGRPVAPVRVKLAPCCGLDCDGVGHWSFRFDVISLQGQAAMADSMWTVCKLTSAQSYSSFSWAQRASAADLQSQREQ